MSSPAETSNPQPTPTPTHTGFDPIEFWMLHQKKIIALAVLLVVGLLGYTVFTFTESRSRAAAEAAYASAKTAEDYRRIVSEHSGEPAAGNAHLQLAALLRKEDKLDDANATLRTFINEYPEHPMLAGAWLALAENAEAAGRQDEALTGYQKVLTTFPNSFAAPLALFGQARIQKFKGQVDLAKRSYEQIQNQYQGTSFQMEALGELRSLNKPQTQSEAQPSPQPQPPQPDAQPAPQPQEPPGVKSEAQSQPQSPAQPQPNPDAPPQANPPPQP